VTDLRQWHPEPAADGHGFYLVGLEATGLHVLAPPAVALARPAEPRRRNPATPSGWRWAIWPRQSKTPEPSIDLDPPAEMSEIDTTTVLILIDDALRELVWSCLYSQLRIARQIGRQRPGHVPAEDDARAGALSAKWLQHELARAFPDRAPLLEPNNDYDYDYDCQVSVDLLPSCQRCSHLPDEHEGASLRTVARWLTERVSPAKGDCPDHAYTWHAGDSLYGTWQPATDPGDHSEFDWGDVPTPTETDSLTEEMLLP
jgi:hypothetical protein